MALILPLIMEEGVDNVQSVTVQPVNYSNIFLPIGSVVPKTDWATLRFDLNINKLQNETTNLCLVVKIIPKFVKKRLSKVLSKPNKNILKVLYKNIKNICQENRDAVQQIYSSFGFKNSSKNNSVELTSRERRQVVVLATIAITSLVTYFSTKELVEMSVADGDELVDTSNNIIQAVQSHENRISRLEEQEKQLKTHLDELTDQMLLGLKTESTFFDLYAVSTYASSLTRHIKEIQSGLYTLLNQNKLHPSLISWKETSDAINALRVKAINRGKELLLEYDTDIYQLKSDFVAFEDGTISVLLHIPLISSSDRMQLYKFVQSPQQSIGRNYQLVVKTENKFLALNSEATLYTAFSSLQNCIPIRDTYVCQQNLIAKNGRKDCLFNLFVGNKEAIETCDFRVEKLRSFGIRLSSEKLFYSPAQNTSSVTVNCGNDDERRRINVEQPSIISISPGCTLSTKEFIFKHNRELFSKSFNPQLISAPGADIFNLLEQKSFNTEVQNFLEMMADKPIALKPIDIEHKFNLHKLQHRTQFMTKAFSSTAGAFGIIIIVGIFCIIRKRGKKLQPQPQVFNSRVTMSSLLSDRKSCDTNPETNEMEIDQQRGSDNKSRFY